MSDPIVPPYAPAFVAAAEGVLGRRFDDLLRISPHVVAGEAREAFVARMLRGELYRASVDACPHYGAPIGPALETVADVIGTDRGRSVVVVRRLDATGAVTWWTANDFDYASGRRCFRTRCPSRARATEVATAEWSQIRQAMRALHAPRARGVERR